MVLEVHNHHILSIKRVCFMVFVVVRKIQKKKKNILTTISAFIVQHEVEVFMLVVSHPLRV